MGQKRQWQAAMPETFLGDKTELRYEEKRTLYYKNIVMYAGMYSTSSFLRKSFVYIR